MFACLMFMTQNNKIRRRELVTVELVEGRDDRCVLMRGGKPLPRKEVNAYLKWSKAQCLNDK